MLLWLMLSLVATPLLAAGQSLLVPFGEADKVVMSSPGCDDCIDQDMDRHDCGAACAEVACATVHCAVYLPVLLAAAVPATGRPPLFFERDSHYRSHSPVLPMRPPIV